MHIKKLSSEVDVAYAKLYQRRLAQAPQTWTKSRQYTDSGSSVGYRTLTSLPGHTYIAVLT